MKVLLFVLLGMAVGFVGNFLGGKYYEKRFGKTWDKMKNYLKATVMCGAGGGLFSVYGYSVTTITGYIILVSALLVISRIDKIEMIIPNVILIALVAVRTLLLGIELITNTESAMFIFLSSVMGVFYGAVIFLVARLFGKNGIGMGDIKLFAVIGYFVGNTVILPLMLVSLLVAMVSGLVQVARKKLTLKDSVSFGPYITAGSLLVMFMGV